MSRDIGVWIVVSLVAIAALTMSAATIESTLSTDPEDMINPDYDTVPIGQDTAETIRQEMESSGDDDLTDDRTASDPEPQPGGGDDRLSEGSTTPKQSLLDRLLNALMYLLAALAGVTIAAVAVSRRDRLLRMLTYAILPPETMDDRSENSDRWPGTIPSDPIGLTWLALVGAVNPERPESMTPREFAAAAIDAGFDEQVVARLTEAFEEITYGGQPITTNHERLAIEVREQLGLNGDTDE